MMFLKTEERPQGEVALTEDQRILLRAAEIIERDGHCKGSYQGDFGGYCLVGALHKASNWDIYLHGGSSQHLWELACRVHELPADWNDAPERTPAEVIMALRKAALP